MPASSHGYMIFFLPVGYEKKNCVLLQVTHVREATASPPPPLAQHVCADVLILECGDNADEAVLYGPES